MLYFNANLIVNMLLAKVFNFSIFFNTLSDGNSYPICTFLI